MIPSRNPCLVAVLRKVETPGQYNDQVAWEEFRQIWVAIDPVRGREVYAGDEVDSVVTHKLRGDFLELEGITPEDRVLYNDTHDYGPHGIRVDSLVFDILAVLPNYNGRDDILLNANLNQLRYGEIVPDVPS